MAGAFTGAQAAAWRVAQLLRRRRMKRRVPFPVLFAIALTIAALLPIYVERTMTHVMFADGSGGTVEWGWKRCTLRSYCADYRYMRREQRPALWLGINAGLAFAYASIATLWGHGHAGGHGHAWLKKKLPPAG